MNITPGGQRFNMETRRKLVKTCIFGLVNLTKTTVLLTFHELQPILLNLLLMQTMFTFFNMVQTLLKILSNHICPCFYPPACIACLNGDCGLKIV